MLLYHNITYCQYRCVIFYYDLLCFILYNYSRQQQKWTPLQMNDIIQAHKGGTFMITQHYGHGDILNMLLEKNDISIVKLSEITEIPKTTLYSMRSRNNRMTSKEVIYKLCKFFNTPIDLWYTYGDGEIKLFFYGPDTIGIDSSVSFPQDNGWLDSFADSESNLSLEYLKYGLQCLGHDSSQYTLNDIKEIIEGKVSITCDLYNSLIYLLTHKQILSQGELSFLEEVRKMSTESKKILEKIAESLKISEKAELSEFTNWLTENNQNIKSKRRINGEFE